MPSFADLFNPSFLMFLGILVLVISLLVVYFETKNREQNHKISSMFSLVSSLADEVNNLKNSLFLLSSHGGSSNEFIISKQNNYIPDFEKNILEIKENIFSNPNTLIPVSDDEHEDANESSDDDDESSDDIDLESVTSSSSSNSNNSENFLEKTSDVKVLKLNIANDTEKEVEHDINDADDIEDLSDDVSISSESSESILAIDNVDTLDHETNNEILHISSSDLKTININLEEATNEIVDYKKLPIQKLKSIVSEKGLATDTSKLKKNELLKLLGIE